ncbi:MAG: hypothetical protein RMJ06_06965, partial [Nitrososphaerota archaeon]|nr:hypothetical protein [Nitrososphaerota archaeon]
MLSRREREFLINPGKFTGSYARWLRHSIKRKIRKITQDLELISQTWPQALENFQTPLVNVRENSNAENLINNEKVPEKGILENSSNKPLAGPVGLEPTICGLGGIKKPPAGFLTTSSTPVIDWDGFARYIFSEYSRRHARDLLLYAWRYGHHLIRRDLSQLLHLPPNKRRHVLMALSALSKYLGCYDEFRRLRETYGIKWAVSDVVPAIVL